MSEELKKIKKLYGEDMMHLCRELFPTILEKPGILLDTLTKTFAPSHVIAKDMINNGYTEHFRNLIISRTGLNFPRIIDGTKSCDIKTPAQLLKEQGYTLYHCKKEEDIQSFRHYYANGEALCTFNGGRLLFCHVFFAVRNDANEIIRTDFHTPKRDDRYSTSVLSIQFARGASNAVSIKSRYNHRVSNPDATFGNDLNKLAPGLAESFAYHYNFRLTQPEDDAHFLYNMQYTSTWDGGVYYRYNHEKNGIYYCDNNIIVAHGEVFTKYCNKERYIFMDQYVLDRKEKKIIGNPKSGFMKTTMLGEIIKTEFFKENDYNVIIIHFNNNRKVRICTNKAGQIIYYDNPNAKIVYEKFLTYNDTLLKINLPKVRRIERKFMATNDSLVSLDAPLVREIFDDFLPYNSTLRELNIPSAKRISKGFLVRHPYYTKGGILAENMQGKVIPSVIPVNKIRIKVPPKKNGLIFA